MGLKVPNDLDYIIWGDDCQVCTPGLFKPGHTPKFLWAVFYDIEACPGHPEPPNNQLFKLEQSPVDSCWWGKDIAHPATGWRVGYSAFQGWLLLDLVTPIGIFPYFQGNGPQCAYYWDTNLRQCINSGGHGGRGMIGNMEDSLIHSLTNDYHFVPQDRTYYERQDVGMDHVLVRLACRKYSSNVLIYIDKEDFEFI